MRKEFMTMAAILVGLATGPAGAMPFAPLSGGAPSASIELAAGGCGAGMRMTVSGRCAPDVYSHTAHHCQPGTHSVRASNGSGYRCVVNR
jgi:hypothetical protein